MKRGHLTTGPRSRLSADRYWYTSAAADKALDQALEADHRRRWDPRNDSPSLATLEGKAKLYGGHYARSRARLLRRAGVEVRELVERSAGRRVWIVTAPGEPLSAAVRVQRTGPAPSRALVPAPGGEGY